MVYYLNLGLILEQALRDIIEIYIERQQFDDVYENFHISVVNTHPFAHMIIEQNPRAADNFPSIVVSTQSDSKPSDLSNMPPQFYKIGLSAKELDDLINSCYRDKKRKNKNGEYEVVIKNGVVQKERIPGCVLVYDDKSINKLKDIANKRTSGDIEGKVYGIQVNTRRRDRISIEIWAENNQLKNEIYEHLRILFSSTLERLMNELYKQYNLSIFDNSVTGERSHNYNFDFDVVLSGSHISFDVDYDVSQIILDTEIESFDLKNLFIEVINHVKEQ